MAHTIDKRYTIIRQLGEGGMGAVYLAEDERLGRQVAVKRLRVVSASPAMVEMEPAPDEDDATQWEAADFDDIAEDETFDAVPQPSPLTLAVPRQAREPSFDSAQEPWAGKLPAWLLWAGIGVIILGLTFGLGCKPISLGTEGSGPLAMQATATATHTPTMTKTSPPTKTSTPTVTMTPTLGIVSTRLREADGMAMVYVPEGVFMMGSEDGGSNEQPVHEVRLDAYWIDQFEVTNGQYEACVTAGACTKPSSMKSYTRDSYYGNAEYADSPVINVDWHQAQAYCAWAGGSLPTEAQWEKAVRGTDGRTYPWGETSPSCSLANYSGCVGDTSAVGSYAAGASPYGILDMAGNVWEWVLDWYDSGYYEDSPLENPAGPASGEYRVLRGGSWGGNGNNLRSAYRNWDNPDLDWSGSGFRCASSP